jgi:SAM-dependent methyltransferase
MKTVERKPYVNLIRRLLYRLVHRSGSGLDFKAAVGGHWEDVGRNQFEFLIKEGLKPDHYLLDVACGSFRGGRFFIPYLMEGHYFAIDKDLNLIKIGIEQVLKPLHLLEKKPQIYTVELGKEPVDLKEILKGSFDYIWIHALFDHIPPEAIRRCFHDLTKVLGSGGRLYATTFLNPHGPDFLEPIIHPRNGSLQGAIVTFPDREYWHHTLEFFESIVNELPELRLDACLYDYPHPLGLRVLRFIKAY